MTNLSGRRGVASKHERTPSHSASPLPQDLLPVRCLFNFAICLCIRTLSHRTHMSEPVSCPLGFGSVVSALSPFHCNLCKGLLHETVKLNPCHHQFCRFCISPAEICPQCGEDILEKEPDTSMSGEEGSCSLRISQALHPVS